MSRSRTRRLSESIHGNGGTVLAKSSWFAEEMIESSYPGSCQVSHTKVDIPLSWTDSEGYYWKNFPPYVPPIPFPDRLNWGKLPTSSEFGLIQAFAELDDTLALFTRKFWSELSYGSFTWGVLPFVSDVKALLETVKNLSIPLDAAQYEDAYTTSRNIKVSPDGVHVFEGSLRVEYRLTGKLDLSFQDQASIWLDRLGFHPDIGTVWDLIPLSFAVDWLIPVGDFLDNLQRGGWVKTANFSGWSTSKYEWSGVMTDIGRPGLPHSPFKATGFRRTNYANTLVVPPYELPSSPLDNMPISSALKKAFNLAYLSRPAVNKLARGIVRSNR